MVVSVVVQFGSCAVLNLGADRDVVLDKEGLVVLMYMGEGLVMVLQKNIGG